MVYGEATFGTHFGLNMLRPDSFVMPTGWKPTRTNGFEGKVQERPSGFLPPPKLTLGIAAILLAILLISPWGSSLIASGGTRLSIGGLDVIKGRTDRLSGPWNLSTPACSNCILENITVGLDPTMLAVDTQDGNLYVASDGSDNITVISGASNRVIGTLGFALPPKGVAFDPLNGRLYVSIAANNSLVGVNVTTGTLVSATHVGSSPGGVFFDPITGNLFVANAYSANLTVVNGTNGRAVGSIPTWVHPWFMTQDPSVQGGRLFVTDAGNGTGGFVTVVNETSNAVEATIPVGSSPTGDYFDRADGDVYVANTNSNNVSVIDAATDKVVASFTVGLGPRGVSASNLTGDLYVSDFQSSQVSVVNSTNYKVIGNITTGVGTQPNWMVGDSLNGYIYVGEAQSDFISVLSPGQTPPIITSFTATPATLDLGGSTTLSVSVSGGSPPYIVSYSGLPPGCTSSNTTTVVCTPTAVGNFSVTVSIVDVSRHSASAQTPIAVNPKLGISSWTFRPSTITVGNTTLGVVNVTGGTPPFSYSYSSLPPQCSGTNANQISCVPTSPGNYSPAVTVTDAHNNTVTAVTALVVVGAVNPLRVTIDFDSAAQGDAPLTVQVTAPTSGGYPAYLYQWNFGDGTVGFSSIANIAHMYNNPGNYTLSVAVSDSKGDRATASGNVIVVSPTPNQLVAQVSFDSASVGYPPLSVTVTGNATGGTAPYTFNWSFGDGANGSGQIVSHTYGALPTQCRTSRCTENLTLLVQDRLGASATTTVPVILLAPSAGSLSVSASTNVSTGEAPLGVALDATASGGVAPYTYLWDFGDGASAAGANVTHIYSTAGTFSAVVTVVDSTGTVAQSVVTIVAYERPTSNLTTSLDLSLSASPTTGSGPLTVELGASASSGMGPYTYRWNFGDGSSIGTGSRVTHTYGLPGVYVAQIVVSDSAGDAATSGVYITVTNPAAQGTGPEPLAISVTMLRMNGPGPLTVGFFPSVHGGTAPYLLHWNFGDGTSLASSGAHQVSHTYTGPGTYYPIVNVTDAAGKVSSWSSALSGFQHPVTVLGSQSTSGLPVEDWMIFALLAAVAVAIVLYGTRVRRKRQATGVRPNGKNPSLEGRTPAFPPQHPAAIPPAPPMLDDPLRDVFAGAF